jgi:L-alanine-DL-glutamate epimerase-like enolase superfamily enzyme
VGGRAPVYRLLGGPTRASIPAYASALGYSLEPEAVGERARALVEQGYRATKWFFRHGPAEGREGMAKNVELARTLCEAVGDDVDIMLDAWMSFDVPYAVELADRIEPYRPRWLEEPVMPDKIEACAEIRASVGIPIATGEHEYTRWGIRALIEAGAADVLQPDVYWAGGLTEMVKICALASTYDLPVVPHGHSVPATVHLIASQPPTLCPILEYLIKWNEVHQFFLKDRITPQGGSVALPDRPGLGMELDDARIERREDVSWG